MNHKEVKAWSEKAKPGDKIETGKINTGISCMPQIKKEVTKL